MARKTVLAVDLGAESGRVMAVHFEDNRLTPEELHRFPNPITEVRGTWHWDILHLWRNIQQGIEKGKAHRPASIGVDTWAVDFGLLDARGELLGNPVFYRDSRTDGMMEKVFAKVPRREVFEQTGIQFMALNTLYQMMSLVESKSPQLAAAQTFLTIPDLLNYWMTGVKACEFTNATTTQMLNPRTSSWAYDLLERLDIPTHILPQIAKPGTTLGRYENMLVIAPATHDTGSAVAGVPSTNANHAYISSGTWSLVGVEIEEPCINDAAYAANVTNEGGVEGTFRLLKNVMGLWILQQCRGVWAAAGQDYSYETLVEMARTAPPLRSLFDVDDERFLAPGDHVAHIRNWCAEHGQPIPESVGEVVRSVLESLALKYRAVIERLQAISGAQVEVIHIVGGGTQNSLLNQFTADAAGIPVIAGPVEATLLGNAALQLIALGELANVNQARAMLAEMGQTQIYTPQNSAAWSAAFDRIATFITNG